MKKNSFILDTTESDVGFPTGSTIHRSAVISALRTHNKLSGEDIAYALSVILPMNLDNKAMAKFLIQVYKLSNTGRFSLSYNMDLDRHIIGRVGNRIEKLVRFGKTREAWPELYTNSELNESDIKVVERMSNREFYAMLNALETTTRAIDIDRILSCKEEDPLIPSSRGIYYESLYSKCYDSVCLYEAERTGKIVALGQESSIPKVAYVTDMTYKINQNGDKEHTRDIYCFNLMYLLERFANGNYINPKTGNNFSEVTISQVNAKYRIELSMYKKHLEITSLGKKTK